MQRGAMTDEKRRTVWTTGIGESPVDHPTTDEKKPDNAFVEYKRKVIDEAWEQPSTVGNTLWQNPGGGSTTGQRGYGIGEVVLYGAPPAPTFDPPIPRWDPESFPSLPPGAIPAPQYDIFKPLLLKETFELKMLEVMDELRTLRQALDRFRNEVTATSAIYVVSGPKEAKPATRVTPKPKSKARLKSSHRRSKGRKGR